MKKLLLVMLLPLFFACKKEEIKPNEPIQPIEKNSFTKEVQSVFDADVIKIKKTEFDGTKTGFNTTVMYLWNGNWENIPITEGVGGAIVKMNDSTGEISITLDMAPIDPSVLVRIILQK